MIDQKKLPPAIQIKNDLDSLLVSFDTNFAWNYGHVKDGLIDLYEKAKIEQWNATTELDWRTNVDPESDILPQALNPLVDNRDYQRMSTSTQTRFRHAQISWQLSQFLHGEQGALIVASQLVAAVPWMDAKLYASSQTIDEARHVEVFSRYVGQKLEWEWPISPALKTLLDMVVLDSRWDFKYLGMQILIEGLAMAAFSNLRQLAQEPLLRDMLHYVMRDESRHVAFGVLSLKGYYDDMPANEKREREDFVIEACELMRDRLVGDDVFEEFAMDVDAAQKAALESPMMVLFRKQLFSRVVPNIKRLGLLTPRVRRAFEALEIIEFEDLDPEELDRVVLAGGS